VLTPGRYIDHQAAVLALAVLGFFLIAWPSLLSPETFSVAPAHPEVERFAVREGGRTAYVPLEAIVRLKAVGNYTEIHLATGETHFDQRGLGALLEELPENLFRIHKSHAVHICEIARLKSLSGSRYSVELTNGQELPVGRSRIDDLRAVLG
ncbi:MAG: LytTR family DNA-binding domain-containing protein, partial [Pseudomonadota bacterium]